MFAPALNIDLSKLQEQEEEDQAPKRARARGARAPPPTPKRGDPTPEDAPRNKWATPRIRTAINVWIGYSVTAPRETGVSSAGSWVKGPRSSCQ